MATTTDAAASRSGGGGGGSADSYIGSVISLTSKYEIRYEGVLYNINTEESSIGLTNVRSFGTEGRKKDGPQVPPNDKIYEYILFRGSDIKDLQVKSSPPVQNTPPIHNDPAIIQSHYSHPAASSTTFPPTVSGSATDLNSHTAPMGAQMGPPGSAFQGAMPLQQPGGLGSWGTSSLPPSVNANGLAMPMYWQGFYAPSGGHPQAHQQSLLQPPAGMSMPHQLQQPMHYPGMNASLPPGASNMPPTTLMTPNFPIPSAPELPHHGLPPASSHSFTSTAPSTLPLNVPSALGSESSVNLSLNKAPTASFSTSASSTGLPSVPHLKSSILDVNPMVPPTSDKPKIVSGLTISDQTMSRSVPGATGTSSASHAEISAPSLVTPSQLLQPGPSAPSSSLSSEVAHKDVEVVQASSSGPPQAPAETQAPILPLPSPPDRQLNGAPSHNHYNRNYNYRGRGRGGRNGVLRPMKFTEDFDFTAMNEKFNKDEVWGDLGKSYKAQLKDKEGDDNEDDEDDLQYEDDNESTKVDSKPVYVKDDFFDSLSSNTLDREQQNGRIKFSEQRKIDTETFGNFPRHRGGRGGRGGRGPMRGGRSQGSYYGRGYGYAGRGRGQSMPNRGN